MLNSRQETEAGRADAKAGQVPMARADGALTRRDALFASAAVSVCAGAVLAGGTSSAQAQVAEVAQVFSDDGTEVPASNITTPGLYLSPLEAYQKWKADPERVSIVDVRTFEEYIFVGHMTMARNVPLLFPKYTRPEAAAAPTAGGIPPGCSGEPNPNFVPAMQRLFAPDQSILVYCSTGARAAMAVNALANAGFSNAYNIVTGLEGSRVNDPGSVFHGKHMRNGWKNLGLPWGYSFDPDLIDVAASP